MLDAVFPPDPEEVARIVTQALAEDRAFHDVTTRALVPDDQDGKGSFLVDLDEEGEEEEDGEEA